MAMGMNSVGGISSRINEQLGAGSAPRPSSILENAMETLERSIGSLRLNVEALESRLQPVMQQANPMNETRTREDAPASSQVVIDIYGKVGRINELSDRLNLLFERLEV